MVKRNSNILFITDVALLNYTNTDLARYINEFEHMIRPIAGRKYFVFLSGDIFIIMRQDSIIIH